MKHGVIGSGPCGALAALLLLQAGFDVDLIEIDDKQKVDYPNLGSRLKLLDGDSSPYDINQILEIEVEGRQSTFYRSKVEAGFSNVWGATWKSPLVSQDDSWVRNYSKVDEIVSKNLYGYKKNLDQNVASECGCDCLHFLSQYKSDGMLNLEVSDLAVRNLDCGCIATGKSYCVHGSVWNSTYLIRECKKFQRFNFCTGIDVQTLIAEQDGISINDSSSSIKYGSITLAAGPLGNTEVLLNSIHGIDGLLIRETRMGFLPFLRYKMNTRHAGAFAFSQFKFDINDEGSEVIAHVQLYAHSEQYTERIAGKIPKILLPIAKQLLKFLTPHMGIALIYLSSNFSESMSVRKSTQERKLLIDLIKPNFKNQRFGRRIWKSFTNLGLLPLMLALNWAKPGESYHLGAVPDVLDEYGFLKSDNRISVAGSFALPTILPGPITHAAMAQTSRLVERLVHQNLERI